MSRPDSLAELAYQQLRSAVLAHQLAAGQLVSVVSLAAGLGMSRSPVRSAIERLVSEGLMTLTPVGAVVAAPGPRELLDALAVRGTLEGLAARLAAPHMGDNDISELRALHSRLEEAVERSDTRGVQMADLEFHQQIQARSGNQCLVDHLTRVQAKVILATYSTSWGTHPDVAIPEHARILAALEARDATGAEQAATQHLANHLARLRQEWEQPSPTADNA